MGKILYQFAGISLMIGQMSLALAHPQQNQQQVHFYQALESYSQAPLRQRFEVLSGSLLGLPYLAGASGEGTLGRFDHDPLVRFDVFDCTTYVEVVLAGLFASKQEEFEPLLKRIRYRDGQVDFLSRNHFPSVDWLPNNQDRLKEVSAQVAKQALGYANASIDKAAWFERLKQGSLTCEDNCDELQQVLHELTKSIPTQQAALPYVPLVALYNKDTGQLNQALLDRIPTPSVISMVRPNWQLKDIIGTNMNVSHQGFLYRQDGRLFIRHASVTHQRVMDEDFLDYFSQYAETSSLKGFNVQKIVL